MGVHEKTDSVVHGIVFFFVGQAFTGMGADARIVEEFWVEPVND